MTTGTTSIAVQGGSQAISAGAEALVDIAGGASLAISGPLGEATPGSGLTLSGQGLLGLRGHGQLHGRHHRQRRHAADASPSTCSANNEYISGDMGATVVQTGRSSNAVSDTLYMGTSSKRGI